MAPQPSGPVAGSAGQPDPSGAKPKQWAARLLGYQETGVLVALAVVVAVFTAIQPRFLTFQAVGDILTVAAELGTVAIGVTLLMIAGEFDLSVGSNFAVSALVLALIMTSFGWSGWVGLPVALLVGILIGLLNGMLTLSTGIPSFIATLGAMMFWRGIALFSTGGWPINLIDIPPFLDFIGGAQIFGFVYTSAIWWLVALAVAWVVLNKTRFGNWVFATGGKARAARSLGVATRRVKLVCFMVSGGMAALAGSLQFGRLGSMSPAWGESLELEAIAAAVIGGTSLQGGKGTLIGTLIGALTMASIRSGLVLVGAPSYWYESFIGLIIVAAVVTNVKLGEAGRWRKA